MVSLINIFLLIGLGLITVVLIGQVNSRVNGVLTRIGLALFRQKIEKSGRKQQKRITALHSVHAKVTYPVYASMTLLYSLIGGIAGTLIAVYGLSIFLELIANAETAVRESIPEDLHFMIPGGGQVTELSLIQVFTLLILSGGTIGALVTAIVYNARWWYISNKAHQREILIDESVARTIAFIYALSRSGMTYPEVIRTVGRNRKSFGESAQEIGVVVKDMDLFGADLMAALERIADRTPSEQFSDFAENFANVLRTGRNVSEYLREQYDQYQEERIANQEQLLELYTALGEGYVAVFVAGPLFFITILLIFGLLTGGLIEFLQVVIYILIPVANLAFIIYIDSISESLSTLHADITKRVTTRPLAVRREGQPDVPPSSSLRNQIQQTDGGSSGHPETDRTLNRIRYNSYKRFEWLSERVLNPLETIMHNPSAVFVVTVPLAIGYGVFGAWPLIQTGNLDPRAIDDLLIQSSIFLLGTFAVFHTLYVRRIRAIEDAVPDLLDRLASTNEAGATFTEALKRVDKSDLGALDSEVKTLINDIEWGARTEKALNRFSDRIGSSTVARVTALLTNAIVASGNVGPVIRIAAEEARKEYQLKKTRRQEMFLYIVIIYLSFIVFLGIAFALQTVLIPAVPTGEEIGTVSPGGGVGVDLPLNPAQGSQKAAYILLLFHSAIVQAFVSGLVAGQMGEGSVKSGAKHAAILLTVAYVVFLIIG